MTLLKCCESESSAVLFGALFALVWTHHIKLLCRCPVSALCTSKLRGTYSMQAAFKEPAAQLPSDISVLDLVSPPVPHRSVMCGKSLQEV